MSLLDINYPSLKGLSGKQFAELVALLCEAEVKGYCTTASPVDPQGEHDTPDEGVDIRVEVPKEEFTPGYIQRSNTIVQVKKGKMPPKEISNEMAPNGNLRSSIEAQAKCRGSYIIASLEDCCTKKMYERRMEAMVKALGEESLIEKIHIDFFDGEKICQWVREHPSVVIWVREKLKRPFRCWRNFKGWGDSQKGMDEEYIMSGGVEITVPEHGPKSTTDALGLVRELVRSKKDTVRVLGLSGVGKTRFVRALFQHEYGCKSLDSSRVIYVKVGAESPDPGIETMLEWLAAGNHTAFVIVDNCDSQQHDRLLGSGYVDGKKIKLITIDYDINYDDDRNITDKVMLRTNGTQTAEKLLYKHIDSNQSRFIKEIAVFAGGNPMLTLALAEQVIKDKSLITSGVGAIFERMFYQRKGDDKSLKKNAEVLSLPYNFSAEENEEGVGELSTLGSLINVDADELNRATVSLLERGIAQERDKWRAILPQAIANILAKQALRNIRTSKLLGTIMKQENRRLLESFAQRLGFLHDSVEAKKIVNGWLHENGLLSPISELDYSGQQILRYVLPATEPEFVIQKIEAETKSLRGGGTYDSYNNIIEALSLLAYEEKWFERCVNQLIGIFQQVKIGNLETSLRIANLFRPHLSGTQAMHRKRLKIVRRLLNSKNIRLESLGAGILEKTLGIRDRTSFAHYGFSAEQSDYEIWPDEEEIINWLADFINLAVSSRSNLARTALAENFKQLWPCRKLQKPLCAAFASIGENEFWLEGYRSVRKTIHFEYQHNQSNDARKVPENLSKLLSKLKPKTLEDSVVDVLKNTESWQLDDEYGRESKTAISAYAILDQKAEVLGRRYAQRTSYMEVLANLKPRMYTSRMISFGIGIASKSPNKQSWRKMIECITSENQYWIHHVIKGFLSKIQEVNNLLYKAMLDEAVRCDDLRNYIVLLHKSSCFEDEELERCMLALEKIDIRYAFNSFSELFWDDPYAHLSVGKLLEFGSKLLQVDNGIDVLIHGISKRCDERVLEIELQKISLEAATKKILVRSTVDDDESANQINKILSVCFKNRDNQLEKIAFHNAIAKMLEHSDAYKFKSIVRAIIVLDLEHCLHLFFKDDQKGMGKRLSLDNAHFINKRIFDDEALIMRLISWCRRQNQDYAWVGVAEYLDLFETIEDGLRRFRKPVIRFVEACPCPYQVLEMFASKIFPTIAVGSLANEMEKNSEAFRPLLKHKDKDIASAAKRALAFAKDNIAHIRKSEDRSHTPDDIL